MPEVDVAARVTWKPLVVCPDAPSSAGIGAALKELGVGAALTLNEYPATTPVSALAARTGANLCLLDVSTNQDQAARLIGEASACMPVVALHAGNDADLILRCVRLGVSEFLSDPAAGGLQEILDRLDRGRTPQTPKRAAKVYCIIPGKPGAGASTLAVHLAIEMQAAPEPVLLVDADPLTATLGFMLKLKSEYHLGDVVRDSKRMDNDLWARLKTVYKGMDVLLAPDSPIARVDMGKTLAGELISFWKERYGVVVIDTPDLRTAAESGFASTADEILLVTTNELAALHATRRAIEFFDPVARHPSRLHVIVNRYDPAAGLKREDLKTALQMDPYAVVANDYNLIQSVLLEGKPAPAGTRFRAGIHALCRQLRGETTVEKKKNASWFGKLRGK